jgi:polyisoprenoid-binding protein YceI
VSFQTGTYRLGPDDGTLSVRTGRKGAAAKAGHDLLIHVTAWQATLRLADDPAETSIELEADATSLRVREGTGGMQSLGDDDKANIRTTIDDEVLKGQAIAFRSTQVTGAEGGLGVQGELTLAGTTRPLAFDLTIGDDGRLTGAAAVKQTEWGMKPYSALFGALKVADEVRVEVDAHLSQSA